MELTLMTTLEYPELTPSSEPLSSSARNAVVTKKADETLTVKSCAHCSNVSCSNKAGPSFGGSCEGSLKNFETGPVCPALRASRSVRRVRQAQPSDMRTC